MEHYPRPERDPDDRTPDDIRAFIRESLIERGGETNYEDAPVLREITSTLQSACLSAHEQGRQLRSGAARLIADLFACSLPKGSELRGFAHDGRITAPDHLWEELAQLRQSDLQPQASEYLNWLAGFLLAAHAPELLPTHPRSGTEPGTHAITYDSVLQLTLALHSDTTHPDASQEQIIAAATGLALDYGIPAVAYLRIPAVDAASPHLNIDFRSSYAGSYDTLPAIFDTYFRVLIRPASDDYLRLHYNELPASEQRALRTQLGLDYQVVATAGKFHVFRRRT